MVPLDKGRRTIAMRSGRANESTRVTAHCLSRYSGSQRPESEVRLNVGLLVGGLRL